MSYPSKIVWSEDQPRSGGGKGKRNYCYLHLPRQKREYAHRYVAKAFISNPDNLPQVNHKDGCHTNNHVSNLEWVSAKQNGEHASRIGLINRTSEKRKQQVKINRQKAIEAIKKPVVCLTKNNEFVKEYSWSGEATEELGINRHMINSVAGHQGYHKTAGGYKWIYKDEYLNNCV